jgi:hypothetical protein
MAQKPGRAKSLEQLRREAADSRTRLGRDLEGLRYELDFPLKFRKSFQRQTVIWVGAAVLAGLAAAVTPARKKKVRVPQRSRNGTTNELLGTGLAIGALKIAATLLRPAVTKFVARSVSNYVARGGFTRRSP